MGTEFKLAPPMETHESVEDQEHTYNFDPVLWGVLVDEWVVSVVHVEVGRLLLRLGEVGIMLLFVCHFDFFVLKCSYLNLYMFSNL